MIHELFAYLHVKSVAEAVDFYTSVFGATEKFRLVEPGGRVGHIELDFNGQTLMLSEQYPELGIVAPAEGGTSVSLHLHVDNCDEIVERAVAHGAALLMKPTDQFYGERSGVIRDPSGHRWNVGHHIEDVTPEEMQRRYDKAMKESC